MTVSLRELQENFQAYVLNKNDAILQSIATTEANAIERIDIYKQGYSLRLLEILEKDFPLLNKIMGPEVFTQFGREYIEAFPSDNFSICIFSRHYSQFLLEQKKEPYWSEIAAFEWATSCALDAADANQIGVAELGSIAPEEWPYIQFTFHPSAKLYKFHYNAPQISCAMMLEQEVPERVHNETAVDFIIWRANLTPFFESVTPQQVWMIHAIHQDKTFAEICEGLCQWLPEEEVALFAAGSLRNWLEKGLFSAIKVAEVAPISDEVETLTA